MTTGRAITPGQTVGPFLSIGLDWGELGACAADPNLTEVIRIGGRLLDGQDEAISDGLIETWQVRPAGFARCLTGPDGAWEVVTVKPEPLPGPDGTTEAPHLDASIFARGLLHRVVTRIYFADETEANGADPVLAALESADARATLIAVPDDESRYRLDLHLSGPSETVFFQV